VVVSLSALFAVSGSNSAAEVCAWSVIDPVPLGRTVTVMVELAPLANPPSWQSIRLLVRTHWPWVVAKDSS
jgi:hypothetical protein